ncbi:MAG TPA: glutaredoxin family protein [Albitalea sp.]
MRRVLPLLLLVGTAWAGVQMLGEWRGERLAREVAAAARPGDIVMIASETCVFCAEARRWFDEHRVAYRECFVERDAACAEAYRALQAPGTPTIVVRGQRLVGFDPQRIAAALGA